MSQRIVVALKAGANWGEVKKALIARGADGVHEPSPADPLVTVVTIPANLDAGEFVRGARMLEGVRFAEPDSLQWSSF